MKVGTIPVPNMITKGLQKWKNNGIQVRGSAPWPAQQDCMNVWQTVGRLVCQPAGSAALVWHQNIFVCFACMKGLAVMNCGARQRCARRCWSMAVRFVHLLFISCLRNWSAHATMAAAIHQGWSLAALPAQPTEPQPCVLLPCLPCCCVVSPGCS